MKETAAKRRDKAGRDRESKAEKSKEPAPQDVEMPEEETAASAAKLPGELDSVTLDGKPPSAVGVRMTQTFRCWII